MPRIRGSKPEAEEDVGVMEDVREPPMYCVLLLNDDYTPMDFVVMILQTIFNKQREAAEEIMMNVHRQGRGLCGVYTHAVAETKVRQVEILAEKHGHPLRCVMEKE